jgi:hypothetical protein
MLVPIPLLHAPPRRLFLYPNFGTESRPAFLFTPNG